MLLPICPSAVSKGIVLTALIVFSAGALACRPTLYESVDFEEGASVLAPEHASKVIHLAETLRRHPIEAVVVQGFLNSRGPGELPEHRTKHVTSLLIAEGIPIERIHPEVRKHFPEQAPSNRVEIEAVYLPPGVCPPPTTPGN